MYVCVCVYRITSHVVIYSNTQRQSVTERMCFLSRSKLGSFFVAEVAVVVELLFSLFCISPLLLLLSLALLFFVWFVLSFLVENNFMVGTYVLQGCMRVSECSCKEYLGGNETIFV